MTVKHSCIAGLCFNSSTCIIHTQPHLNSLGGEFVEENNILVIINTGDYSSDTDSAEVITQITKEMLLMAVTENAFT